MQISRGTGRPRNRYTPTEVQVCDNECSIDEWL